MTESRKVLVICSDDRTAEDLKSALMRISGLMGAVKGFINSIEDIPDGADDTQIVNAIRIAFPVFAGSFHQLFPEGHTQFDIDLETIGTIIDARTTKQEG